MKRIRKLVLAGLCVGQCLAACESEEVPEPAPDPVSDPASDPAPEDIAEEVEPPTAAPAASLLDALRTRYVSAQDFDVWRCSSDFTDIPVAYLFPDSAAGTYVVIDAAQGFSAGFEATVASTVAGADVLLLTYADTGVAESVDEVLFAGDDRWVGSSNTDGALTCERQTIRL